MRTRGMSTANPRGPAAAQRGLVVGRRFAGGFGSGFTDELAFACVPVFGAAFFFAAGVFPVVATAPEETRDECLVRCRVFFGAAASAIDDSANAAIRTATNIFIVLRTIPVLPRRYSRRSAYDSTASLWMAFNAFA